MAKLIYDAGINDGTRPSKMNGKHLPQYEMWRGMIRRCYSQDDRPKNSSYDGCTVSKNFKNYSYFYDWYNSQVKCNNTKYNLDKDLIIKGNRIYSEENCVLIPTELNILITKAKWKRGKHLIGVTFNKRQNKFQAQISINGRNVHIGYFNKEIDAYNAYKNAKEAYVKDMAEKWRGRVSHQAYNALMNYTVEITD